jgi:hypothetical protein
MTRLEIRPFSAEFLARDEPALVALLAGARVQADPLRLYRHIP